MVDGPDVGRNAAGEVDDRPVLLACSHGTRSRAGQTAVAALVAAVATSTPEAEVRQAFVDVESPDVPTALTELAGREVHVVPLLLSAGYHVHVDLTDAITGSPSAQHAERCPEPVEGSGCARPATPILADALGPDPLLIEILADRVSAAGVRPEDTVLLAAAGSSDPRAVADCRTVADELAHRLGRPVTATFLVAVQPAVTDEVVAARRDGVGRVIVASYLLAPGFFTDLLAGCGADVITTPLLDPTTEPDPRLVALVQRRHREV